MQNGTEKNWKELIFPVIWEALFVASCLMIALRDDKRHFTLTLYFMFVFYLGLIVRYHRDFSIRAFLGGFLKWKEFILPVLCTAAGVAFSRAVFSCISTRLFSSSLKIILPLAYSSSVFELVLFAVTVMALQPVACELFYRRGCIFFSGRWMVLLTALAGMAMEAVARSATPLGMLETAMLAVPFVISYCVTKNVYIPLFVHLILNIIINMPDVVYDFMRLALA
ncbi:MAG: hypothetical protein K5696_05305 [Lachnospiraceae bacterium]|nr:hypothetical protein [Lachnospiraceae bacterium]